MNPTYLAIKNAHPRDKYITFDEGPHIYTVHGEKGYTSVTTWNHHHFPPFEGDKIIDNLLKGKKMNINEVLLLGLALLWVATILVMVRLEVHRYRVKNILLDLDKVLYKQLEFNNEVVEHLTILGGKKNG